MYIKNILVFVLMAGLIGCSTIPESGSDINYEYGLFETVIIDHEAREDHVSGQRSFVDDERTINALKTRSIQGELGVVFGVRYEFPKELYERNVLVFQKVTFPEVGLANPRSTEIAYDVKLDDRYYIDKEFNSENLFYKMSEPWEVVPGEWKFEVFLNGEKYLEEIFFVTVD